MLPFAKDSPTTTTSADGMSLKETIAAKVLTTSVNSETIETYGKQKFLVNKLNQDTDGQQSRLSGQQGTGLGHSSLKSPYLEGPGPVVRDFNKAETRKLPEDGSSAVSSLFKFLADVSSQPVQIFSRCVELGKDLTDKFGLASSKVSPSNPSSNGNHIFPITSDGGSSLEAPSYFQSNQSGNSNTKSSIAQFPVGPFGNFSRAKQAAGQSSAFYSSETTAYSGGYGTSTTAGIAEPLPAIRSSQISSQQNFTLGKSSKDKSQPNKENYRAASPTRLLNSEPHLSKQFGNVEEMIKELETLLGCIEGAGGFLDACTVLHESSVFEVEEGIGTLLNRCGLWKSIMYERLGEIQLILDNTVQVLARKTCMEGIVKQATDGQYWDLWNRQKLSSELELKQQHISKELTNQLIELERHLNTLELNKFGENDDVRMSQRAFPGRFGPSRHVQSLHTLRSTMSSQLAAAEQLSECLSKQMAVLSIEPPSVKKQNVRKELFEAIGIPYNTASFSSPDEKIAGNTPSNNKLLMSSCSDAVKGQSRRNQSSAMRGCESETARRRRDSLDQSWASFEPRKTMVKRMLLHEDRPKASTDRSALLDKKHVKSPTLEGSEVVHTERLTATSTLFYPSDEKGIQDRMTKQASEIPSTSCQWFDEPSGSSQSMGLKSSATQVSPVNNFSAFSSHSAYMSSTIASQNNVRGSFNPTANLSSSGVTIVEKPDSLSVNDSKFIQKSKSELHQTPSISKRLPGQTLSLLKKPSETSNSSDKETNLVKSTIGYGNHQPSSTKSSFLGSGKGLQSPFYHASVGNPAPNLNADVFQSDSAASKTQSSRIASSSTFLLSSSSSPSSPLVHSPLLIPSSLPAPTEETSSPAISMGRSLTNFKASINDSQTTLISQSSGSSPIVSSDSSYQVPEKTVPTATPIPSMTLEPESPKRALQPSIGKLSSTTDENARLQGSSRMTEPAFTLKFESSLPSRPTTEPSANLQSGSKLSFNGMGTPGMNAALNSKPVPPFRTDVLSAAVLSTSGGASGGKSEVADVAVNQEDEMEEEAPETSQTTELSLGSLGSFGIGSSPNPTPAKANPFGATFVSAESTPASSPFNLTVPTGELFRPASFSFQSPQPFQPSQVTNFGAFSGGFNTGTTPQVPAGSGFGQPAQVGSGQQALGSVLGAFGQSRQLGGVLPGTSASSASGFSAGLISSPSTGGFTSTGSGFGSLASASGGFAGAASAGSGFAAAASAGGGFGGIASTGGGFGGIASAGGGFAATASAGGGFAGAASGSGFPSSGGGFGAFNNQQGSGGFSAFSSSAGGTGRPPSTLFTQMRK